MNAIRYDGKAALEWANKHRYANWMVWRFERSKRLLVLCCQQGDPQEVVGFLVLRGVQHADFVPSLGEAAFALESAPPNNSESISDADGSVEIRHLLKIEGDSLDSSITLTSLSAYELARD